MESKLLYHPSKNKNIVLFVLRGRLTFDPFNCSCLTLIICFLRVPSDNDNLKQALQWTKVAEALHSLD